VERVSEGVNNLPELPNIVSRKLAERELRPDASHPDADLLTAFAEQALPERERGAVLSHLADCASCRDIVILAQPPGVEGSLVISSKPSRFGRSFPSWGLGWGVLAASAALVVGFAMLHQRQPGDAGLLAKNQMAEPGIEKKRMEPPSADTAVAGDREGGTSKVAEKPAPAAPGAEFERRRESDAPVVIAQKEQKQSALALNAKASPAAVTALPAPSTANGNAGFLGHDAFVGGYISSSKGSNLPLQGRNFDQLMELKPGAVGIGQGAGTGVAAGAGASDAAQAAVPAATPSVGEADRDAIAKKDEASVSLRKSLASANVAEKAKARSDAASKGVVVAFGAVAAASTRVVGEVRGLVVDSSGAAVAGAKVTITNTATGASLASSTNEAGIYDVPSIPAGPYTIDISKSGFQEYVRPGLNVEPSTIALNATLRVGAVSETVEVTAQAPSVETSSSDTVAYGGNDKGSFRASSAGIANLPGLVAARPAGTWQITSAGNLQRSFDGGKSWESVAVPGDPPSRLRVVAATGFQVWVGGNGGVLLHSQDAGGHFTNVNVHKKHATLSGDIVALTFPDAQHGRLETADHDVWTTSDGGGTWRPSAAAK
jgi:hypothetical protein